MGVTDALSGQSLFFSKNSPVDFYELLRASCSVPYFARKSVDLAGRSYYDGTIGSVSGLEQAVDAQNILLVLTRPAIPLPKMILFRKILKWLLIRKETPELQNAIWNMVARYDEMPNVLKATAKNKNIVVIQPKKSLPMFRIDNRLSRLLQTMRQGYTDVMDNLELDNFFKKLSS